MPMKNSIPDIPTMMSIRMRSRLYLYRTSCISNLGRVSFIPCINMNKKNTNGKNPKYRMSMA